MDSLNTIKSIRHLLANDSSIRSILGSTSKQDTLDTRLFYKDSVYAAKIDGYDFPHIAMKLDSDPDSIRGADDNCLYLEIDIVSSVQISGASLKNLQIRDSIKKLLNNKHLAVNSTALTFSPAVVLKVRDISWVSGITYDDKEQGSERRHKMICLFKLVVGD